MDRQCVVNWLNEVYFTPSRAFSEYTDDELKMFAHDALAMMKEQEAVEPGIAQYVDGIFATCGNCKKKLWKMIGLEFVVNPDEMPRFCPHCGRSVKWDG